jgi:tRNA pseudouridine38-40 synthase
MARYQIILAYDGTEFQGFQRQGHARTVQGVVEGALRQIGWLGASLLAAGRTDTGVHASGQAIVFDLEWKHSLQALLNALNAHLPADVAAQRAQVAPDGFHPRFDATSRSYRYTLFGQPARDPLRERYAWRVWPSLELEKLQLVAHSFLGRHDFAVYGTPPQLGGSTWRTIFRAEWLQQADQLTFEVCADAFLYRMVRRLVFIQVAVARGRIKLEEIQPSLLSFPGQPIHLDPGLAPPQGLALTEVSYLPDLGNPRIIRQKIDEEIK